MGIAYTSRLIPCFKTSTAFRSRDSSPVLATRIHQLGPSPNWWPKTNTRRPEGDQIKNLIDASDFDDKFDLVHEPWEVVFSVTTMNPSGKVEIDSGSRSRYNRESA